MQDYSQSFSSRRSCSCMFASRHTPVGDYNCFYPLSRGSSPFFGFCRGCPPAHQKSSTPSLLVYRRRRRRPSWWRPATHGTQPIQSRLSNVHLTSRSAVVAAVGLVGRGQSMRDAAISVRTARWPSNQSHLYHGWNRNASPGTTNCV